MGLSSKKEKKTEKELNPKDCVVRLCRFCKEPMELTSYEFLSHFKTRGYAFHCNTCDFDTELTESVDEEDFIGFDGYTQEPLTKEEIDEMKEKKIIKELKNDPNHALALNAKGLEQQHLGNYEWAITLYEKAIDIDEKFATAWYNKGHALMKLGKHEEAIIAFDKALEIDPDDADVWSSKGNALSFLGKHEEAIIARIRSSALFPTVTCSNSNESIFFNPHANCADLLITPDDILIPDSSTLSSKIDFAKE